MVTRYDVAGGQAIFELKCMYACFSTSFNNKSTACGWNDGKCLFMCYFTFQAPKGGLTWFLILGKIQNGGQNGDHCWCRHRPPAAPPPTKYTSSRWEDQRLSTKSKIVSKYILQHIKNCREGFLQPPPPTPLVPRWGYELRVRPRVRTAFIIYGWGLWGCFSLENILRVVP